MTQPTAAATTMAQRLWGREQVNQRSAEAVTAVVGRVCVQLQVGIERWIGIEGYRILLERALAEARKEHPALGELQCRGDSDDRIVEAVRSHGATDVVKAFLGLVALLVDQLGRVVGSDMAARLVEQSWRAAASRSSDTKLEGVG